jgi:excisionase family DNA binding protein
MAKKYLTLEEAAHLLGMAPDELVRLRERGEIRGFADRGTWKFKSEDVEEFGRSRDADSSPEVPILDATPSAGSPTVDPKKGASGRFNKMSDSDVRLLLDDTLVPGSKDSDPEVTLSRLGSSDSDVRLMDDAAGVVDSGSDSDVKLISTSSEVLLPAAGGSSSDASDSDVKLVSGTSDSDVRLAQTSDDSHVGQSDSDVRLVGTDDLATLGSESDIRLTAAEGSSVELSGTSSSSSDESGPGSSIDNTAALGKSSSDESSVLLADSSGIALDSGSAMKVGGGSSADSGITLQSLADSGISLEKVDSGISLAGAMDSGIALDADSGIALERKEDSGIALSADSGIAISDSGTKKGEKGKTDKGKKDKGKKADMSRTAPQLKVPDDEDSTSVEMPTLGEEDDSSYKLHDDRPKTNVVLFSDEEDEEKAIAPPARGGKKGRPDDSFALQEESGVEFSEAEGFSDDEDLEVADDVLEGDGDLDQIDVFEPAEEDFEGSSVQSGESHAEFAPPVAMRAAVPVETPWDALTFAGLTVSSVCLVLTGVVMYDLVRSMWHWDDKVIVGGALLDMVKGLF